MALPTSPDREQSGIKRAPFHRWLALWPLGALLGMALLVAFAPFPAWGDQPAKRLFSIEASQFAYSPPVISVNPGDHVTIELLSTDVVHGLSIDGYDLETTSDPGQTASLSFVADRQGSYRFRCSATCGNMHPFMIGKLQVGHNTLLWRGAGLAVLVLIAGVWRWRR